MKKFIEWNSTTMFKRRYKIIEVYYPETESFRYIVYHKQKWLSALNQLILLLFLIGIILYFWIKSFPYWLGLLLTINNVITLVIFLSVFVVSGFRMFDKWQIEESFNNEEAAINYVAKKKATIEEKVIYLDK